MDWGSACSPRRCSLGRLLPRHNSSGRPSSRSSSQSDRKPGLPSQSRRRTIFRRSCRRKARFRHRPTTGPMMPSFCGSPRYSGAVHYLRELCGAQEGQLWREQMKEIVKNEGSTAVRRAKLVNSFNDGYRGYRRTYRTCTSSATLAITRFSTEGAQIAAALAKPSHYASRGSSSDTSSSATDAAPAPVTGDAPAATDGAAPAPEARPAEANAPAANQTERKSGRGSRCRGRSS